MSENNELEKRLIRIEERLDALEEQGVIKHEPPKKQKEVILTTSRLSQVLEEKSRLRKAKTLEAANPTT